MVHQVAFLALALALAVFQANALIAPDYGIDSSFVYDDVLEPSDVPYGMGVPANTIPGAAGLFDGYGFGYGLGGYGLSSGFARVPYLGRRYGGVFGGFRGLGYGGLLGRSYAAPVVPTGAADYAGTGLPHRAPIYSMPKVTYQPEYTPRRLEYSLPRRTHFL